MDEKCEKGSTPYSCKALRGVEKALSPVLLAPIVLMAKHCSCKAVFSVRIRVGALNCDVV